MGNAFDSLTDSAFDTVANTMGYLATWNRAGYSPTTAKVLYNDVSGEAKLGDKKFGIDNWKIEYKDSDFPGLKESVNGNGKEPIQIMLRGVATNFIAIDATPLVDGITVELKLRQKL